MTRLPTSLYLNKNNITSVMAGPRIMHILVLLLLTFGNVSGRTVSGDQRSSVDLENTRLTIAGDKPGTANALPIGRRDGEQRDVCGQPANGEQLLSRRSMLHMGTEVQNISTHVGGLYPRIMNIPKDDKMIEFYVKEMDIGNGFKSIVWTKDAGLTDISTSVFEELGTDQAISLGTAGLEGCTVLVVVSRTGVYMAHFWENIAFSPDKVWIEEYKTAEGAFIKSVLDSIKKRIRNTDGGTMPEQVSLASVAPIINKDGGSITGYLVIPDSTPKVVKKTQSDPDYHAYQAKWASMRKVVAEFIPALKDGTISRPNTRWTEITYSPKKGDELYYTSAGKVLLKYDPDHYGKKKIAFWVENDRTPKHDNMW